MVWSTAHRSHVWHTRLPFMQLHYWCIFNLSTRLNSLLLQHQRYISSLELPMPNWAFWIAVLPMISPLVTCLNITKLSLVSFDFLIWNPLSFLHRQTYHSQHFNTWLIAIVQTIAIAHIPTRRYLFNTFVPRRIFRSL